MDQFHLLRPYWLLAFIPVVLLLWRFHRRSANAGRWRNWCDAGLLPYILAGNNGQTRRLWPLIITALVAALAIVSLAGPVWKQMELPVFRQQSALVIVLDLSLSMDAGDITPSRLSRARFKVIDILKQRREGQTALVVYAGDAHVVSPLTQDSATIIDLAKILTTDLMPERGSRTDRALEAAVKLLHQGGVNDGRVLLITDGIEQGSAEKLAAIVSDAGYRLSVLGVGTRQGAPISLPGGGYLKDSTGAIILPRLDAQELRDLARRGGGRYSDLALDDSDLNTLLAEDVSTALKRRLEKSHLFVDQWREEGPWLLLLILPLVALAFRRGYLLVFAIVMLPLWPHPARALEWQQLWSRPDQVAARTMKANSGQTPAAETFDDPAWQAAAHYRSSQYQQAVAALDRPGSADDFYNRANALARLGRLQEAIDNYDQALKLAPDHADAQYNRKLVQDKLKQQQQQQNSDDNQDGKQDRNQDGKKNGSEDSSRSSADSQANSQQGDGQQQDQHQDQASSTDNTQRDASSGSDRADAEKGKSEAGRGEQQDQGDDHRQQGAEQARSDDSEQQGQAREQASQTQSARDRQQSDADSGNSKQTEAMQATEQWLRMIPDDPGGLLRQKFLYEYQRKSRNQSNADGASTW